MKETWICAKCGRTFSRKWSGQRHLLNVENGEAPLVTSGQYEMGIRTGVIVPSFTRAVFAKKQDTDIVTLIRQKLKEKFVNYLAEKAMEDADSRRLVAAIFMNELLGKQVQSDNNDELLNLFSKLKNGFEAR